MRPVTIVDIDQEWHSASYARVLLVSRLQCQGPKSTAWGKCAVNVCFATSAVCTVCAALSIGMCSCCLQREAVSLFRASGHAMQSVLSSCGMLYMSCAGILVTSARSRDPPLTLTDPRVEPLGRAATGGMSCCWIQVRTYLLCQWLRSTQTVTMTGCEGGIAEGAADSEDMHSAGEHLHAGGACLALNDIMHLTF